MEKLGIFDIDSSEKTIVILGDRWWPQTVKHEGDKMSKSFCVIYLVWKRRAESPNVEGVSITSRGSALLKYSWGISPFDHVQKVNQQLTQTKPYNNFPP